MTTRETQKLARIRSRCGVLAKTIFSIQEIYLKADTDQKAFIETMIGAAIWYIPKPINAWTGFMSIELLKSFLPDSGDANPKISEEHVYPRKVAARELLINTSLNEELVHELFNEKYGRLHYITPSENKLATRHQRNDTFTTPEEVYEKAGIRLIKVDRNDLPRIKKRDRHVIEKYLIDR